VAVEPGLSRWDRQKTRGTIFPHRSRRVSASAFIDQRCIEGMLEPHCDGMRERKIMLKLHSRTPSLLQDGVSLPGASGFNRGLNFAASGSWSNAPLDYPDKLRRVSGWWIGSVIPLENGIQVKGVRMDPGFHRGDDQGIGQWRERGLQVDRFGILQPRAEKCSIRNSCLVAALRER